ncbi:MAG: hypothetical protein AVDCRST_MAG11-1223 [uncultured Gemmatimonadaceae bacterium]|uniref:NmrA-like domain-containing protein n=1 Tax=uncultured Gemmatimonadaceae bacterium TaxID=246130 RepID=A0A6J4KIE4_9BACT|nr:MAG: hypothetical protein AVDCRST_MAG11-1223 [uncultured Gemmatimonadaceae bacterium]
MPPAKPTILVTGATGAQGGSVARHLLAAGRWNVRALTRRPDGAPARALSAAGAQVVAGDLGDPPSLRSALEGCDGAFGVTNFWEHFDAEAAHGRNLLDAVAASGARHFVFSTLPSYYQLSGGELRVPHCDIKGQLEDDARERGLPVTFVRVAFYYENFLSFFPPRPQEDGSFGFGFPQGDTPLAAVSVEDVGGVVAPIFARPDAFTGRTVGVVGDDRPVSAYAEAMSGALGRRVAYRHVPREVFASLGFPGAEELANMFDVQRRFVPTRQDDLEESRALYPAIRSFDAWVAANAPQLERVLTA